MGVVAYLSKCCIATTLIMSLINMHKPDQIITNSSSKANLWGVLLHNSGQATTFLFQKHAGIHHTPILERKQPFQLTHFWKTECCYSFAVLNFEICPLPRTNKSRGLTSHSMSAELTTGTQGPSSECAGEGSLHIFGLNKMS